ncbi:MAG: hypothetical protein NC489_29555, partial [Ruminococcus flavefaciens]|nr:hypothetical protein [Ruminococcus flavefaciens]
TEAIEDVNLIKNVIDRTQNDFSRIANFFIAIGAINTVICILYFILLQIIKGMDSIGYGVFMFIRGLNGAAVIGYAVLFFVYRYKLKRRNNALSLSLINIWGALLIGGELFRVCLAVVNFEAQESYFYQKTLQFLFPIVGCLVLGFVMQDKLIQRVAFAIVVLYMFLTGTGLEIKMDSFHGSSVNVGLDEVLTSVIVSAGMILLGFYLKRKGEK